jgi:ribosomal protein L11 methyltransferase
MFVFHIKLPVDVALLISQVITGDMTLNLPRKNRKYCRVDFFCRSRDDVRRRMSEVSRFVHHGAPAGSRAHYLAPLKKKDWVAISKKHFQARRVSRRIIIKPPWEDHGGRKNDLIVEIDPGMAFGTGEHATTRTCLKLIDEFQAKCPGASFLDAGCGSGIFAIAAAKLGFRPVHAIDNDPAAVRAAGINCARNNVSALVVCRSADILRFKPERKYQLVVANLFANLLVRSSGRLSALLERDNGSRLVISGILDNQYPLIRKAFLRRHLREDKKVSRGEWVTAVFKWKQFNEVSHE